MSTESVRKKILIVHSHYLKRGGEDLVFEMETELLSKSHDVEVLTFNNKSGLKGGVQFLYSIWNISASNKIKKAVEKFNPDVVHIHNWHFSIGPIIFRTCKRNGVPTIHTLHNYRLACPSAILMYNDKIYLSSLNTNFPWNAILKKVYRNSFLLTFWLAFIIWFHKKISTWAAVNSYIALTPFAKKIISDSSIGISANQIFVKPNFIKKETIQKKEIRDEHFLFVGRLSDEKGIHVLLNSFKESDYKLKIAGYGPCEELVNRFSQTNSNVDFVGSLEPHQVMDEMKKCQALIFPSIWYEGMPMTIIEAFSEGTSVIASNLGAMSIMIEDGKNGLLFKPGDSSSLRKQLKKWNDLSIHDKTEMRNQSFLSFDKKYSESLQPILFNNIFEKIIK